MDSQKFLRDACSFSTFLSFLSPVMGDEVWSKVDREQDAKGIYEEVILIGGESGS
jgi:hypothetical protein